mmetsp:Transcript_20756/g.20108  ORF Transcript_20756/g.20108 Transcript_20756/m.20108 type:complete len:247 (-) Transcript_20756:109-849(-)
MILRLTTPVLDAKFNLRGIAAESFVAILVSDSRSFRGAQNNSVRAGDSRPLKFSKSIIESIEMAFRLICFLKLLRKSQTPIASLTSSCGKERDARASGRGRGCLPFRSTETIKSSLIGNLICSSIVRCNLALSFFIFSKFSLISASSFSRSSIFRFFAAAEAPVVAAFFAVDFDPFGAVLIPFPSRAVRAFFGVDPVDILAFFFAGVLFSLESAADFFFEEDPWPLPLPFPLLEEAVPGSLGSPAG